MKSITDLFQLFSDPTRLRILTLLYHQDLCVCELTEIMGESQPKISKHIAKLRTADLVNANRNEQYVYYSLNEEYRLLQQQLDVLIPSINSNEPYQQDLQLLHAKSSFVCTGGNE